MSNFDERSGIIECKTAWGRWWQTSSEVHVEIVLGQSVSAKEIKCLIETNHVKCAIKTDLIFEGKPFAKINAAESTWVLEEKTVVHLLLVKINPDAANCWHSLLADGQYSADPWTLDQMQRKLTLERFQSENPGMDFSGAEISGQYQNGGPRMPL